MTALVWAANVLGWPAIHMTICFAVLRIRSQAFAYDTWLTAPRCWERDGNMYRDWFAIRKWKSLLPDGAPWLGGPAKKKLLSRNPAHISQFLIETRRAEIAHWCMLACLPFFFLWNPPWARWVITGYALAANLPCILAQRYNRFLVRRMARRPGRRTAVYL
jgi:glycosyl-4,4'-diaponeurosporenoate acyltransferase